MRIYAVPNDAVRAGRQVRIQHLSYQLSFHIKNLQFHRFCLCQCEADQSAGIEGIGIVLRQCEQGNAADVVLNIRGLHIQDTTVSVTLSGQLETAVRIL